MNNKSNAIKWIAIITMTIDHIGAYLFPEYKLLRVIGRISLPCFLYSTIYGVKYTKNFPKYLVRLLAVGIISISVTSTYGVTWNILFVLSIFAVTLYDWRFFLPGLFLSQYTEYGIYGLLLGWAIKITIDHNRWLGLVLLLILHVNPQRGMTQSFALLGLIPILLPLNAKLPRLPKWLGYSYYPIHLLFLQFLSRFWY